MSPLQAAANRLIEPYGPRLREMCDEARATGVPLGMYQFAGIIRTHAEERALDAIKDPAVLWFILRAFDDVKWLDIAEQIDPQTMTR